MTSPERMMRRQQSPRLAIRRVEWWRRARRQVEEPWIPCEARRQPIGVWRRWRRRKS